MKLFFYIATFMLSTTAIAANEPIVSTKAGQPKVYASLPKQFGKTVYENAVIERTQTGSYLFIKNPTVLAETFIFFREENGVSWKEIGKVCSELSEITYSIMNHGWDLKVTGKDCAHTYEKVLTFSGAMYVEK